MDETWALCRVRDCRERAPLEERECEEHAAQSRNCIVCKTGRNYWIDERCPFGHPALISAYTDEASILRERIKYYDGPGSGVFGRQEMLEEAIRELIEVAGAEGADG